jgi:hypothetical protein
VKKSCHWRVEQEFLRWKVPGLVCDGCTCSHAVLYTSTCTVVQRHTRYAGRSAHVEGEALCDQSERRLLALQELVYLERRSAGPRHIERLLDVIIYCWTERGLGVVWRASRAPLGDAAFAIGRAERCDRGG